MQKNRSQAKIFLYANKHHHRGATIYFSSFRAPHHESMIEIGIRKKKFCLNLFISGFFNDTF